MAMLEAHGLIKRYGPLVALHGVDVSLAAGELVGFLGPNGAGKSTTMNILSACLAPTAGSVRIAGHKLENEALACRRQVGYLPQTPPLYPDMTVQAYLLHVTRLKGIAAAKRRREVVDAMATCDLEAVATRHIRKLSGGNRQRVGLAQALLGRPPILILDEPTAGLDPTQVHNLRGLLRDLRQRHSILLSTHVLAEVEAVCSRVLIINQGRIVLSDHIEHLRERSRERQRLGVRLRDPSRLGELQHAVTTIDGIEQATIDQDQLLVQGPEVVRDRLIDLAQKHGGLRELTEQRRSLEDVFTEITTESDDHVRYPHAS